MMNWWWLMPYSIVFYLPIYYVCLSYTSYPYCLRSFVEHNLRLFSRVQYISATSLRLCTMGKVALAGVKTIHVIKMEIYTFMGLQSWNTQMVCMLIDKPGAEYRFCTLPVTFHDAVDNIRLCSRRRSKTLDCSPISTKIPNLNQYIDCFSS